MTRQRLERFRKLQQDRANLEHRLTHWTFRPKEQVADTAKDYRTGYPHTIVISGFGDSEYAKARDRWAATLRKIINEMDEVIEWIEDIQDPEIRVIFRMYYVDGYTQDQVAEAMCLERSTISKKIAAAFEESPHD